MWWRIDPIFGRKQVLYWGSQKKWIDKKYMIMWSFKKKKKREIEFVEKRKTDSIFNSNAVKVRQQKQESENHCGRGAAGSSPLWLINCCWPLTAWAKPNWHQVQTNKQAKQPWPVCVGPAPTPWRLWASDLLLHICVALCCKCGPDGGAPAHWPQPPGKKFGQFVK